MRSQRRHSLGCLAQRLSTNRLEAQVTNACKTPLFLLVLLEIGLTKTVNHFEICHKLRFKPKLIAGSTTPLKPTLPPPKPSPSLPYGPKLRLESNLTMLLPFSSASMPNEKPGASMTIECFFSVYPKTDASGRESMDFGDTCYSTA